MDFKLQLKKAYDKDAKRRDKAEGKRDQWKLDLREKFANFLQKENKKTILELGSGAGLDAKYFQDKGFEVVATDLSSEMVKMCRKRGLNAKVVDLYNLNSLNTKFDGIYSMNVLLHVPKKDLEKVLNNIANALNKEGIFFYGVYGGYDGEETFTDKSKMDLPRFFSFLSDRTIQEIVKDKFDVVEFKTIDIGNKKPNFYFQSLLLRKKR